MASSVAYMTNQSGIRPFRIEIPQADLDDLRARLARTRWPARPRADDWSRGVPLYYPKQLDEYWATGFDWPARAAGLNRIPQYTTELRWHTRANYHLYARPSRPPSLSP